MDPNEVYEKFLIGTKLEPIEEKELKEEVQY